MRTASLVLPGPTPGVSDHAISCSLSPCYRSFARFRTGAVSEARARQGGVEEVAGEWAQARHVCGQYRERDARGGLAIINGLFIRWSSVPDLGSHAVKALGLEPRTYGLKVPPSQ